MYKNYKSHNMAAQTLQNMLGEKLSGKNGATVDVKSLFGKDKVIGLYFSAHWCPPCRGFTPELAIFYNEMKKKNPNFEIVFASSDKDEKSFQDYFDKMPWLALPYEQRDLKEKLSKKFKVSGIPTFVILDGETGETITKNGRAKVDSDKEGKDFPWREKPFKEIIGGKVLDNKGAEKDISEAMKGKYTGLYFSAHWCPPCRGFTPKLADFYNKNAKDKNFEIIFASADQDEKQFKEYFDEMPWLAFPYGDDRIETLNETFEIQGIPALVILDENGKVVNKNARGGVDSDPDAKDFPWLPKPVEPLDGSSAAEKLNEECCLVYFTGDSEEDEKNAREAMEEEANKEFCQGEEQKLFFYVAKEGGGLTGRLKEFGDVKERGLVIFNISNQEKCECPDKNITKETVKDFICKFNEDKLEKKKIGK